MVKYFTHIFLSFILVTNFIFSQTNKKIQQSNTQLNSIQREIRNLESDLSELQENEKESVKILENISHQSHLLDKIILRYTREERELDKKITSLTSEIKVLKAEIDKLKDDYARYIRWLYMNAQDSKLAFLVNAKSLNQAVVRYKYLNYITDKNEERLEVLQQNKKDLEEKTALLKIENDKKHLVVVDKRKEQRKFISKEQKKKKLISKLKEDQASVEKEIDKKRIFEIDIKARIAKLIEAERRRKIKSHEENVKGGSVASTIPQFDYSNFENFTDLKGTMSWPVSTGKVGRSFGENKNQKLKTVTLNYGIDIESNPKEKVYAVAQGLVSVIDWIPGFGSIIIVTHKGDYRTVYGHIVDIQVREGDVVNAGTQLGLVNESLEGNIMHFEIWSERNYQNPENWLVKK
ncbi:MAG: peptidoglycan DD-metalloendopeptidase family protein [Bacteroidota bacterium]